MLGPMAAGAALSATAFLVSDWYQQSLSPTDQLIWSYKRNDGPELWAAHGTQDPSTRGEPGDYAAFVAQRCQISSWSMDSNIGWTDVDSQARLIIEMNALSDKDFNCLASFVRPPYVTLSRKRT